ncbi:MAG TPA: CoA-binding protein [Deltaproteobacteria bacterium]|nr:CoA-binding protein [Deltaproteobacteria bacterium]HRW80464.1 CoA-binding protein [Desulfomonilia bacterium]HNQ84932.1 CoA-binding protein [Deltaproteobacteria bacterium]HNS88734.1 CoA-binding protein [Deltaproteobacteria bacterium]HOA43586.1 CoA-binding protein [Deltaproteobacteria bacterium]
MVQADDKRLRRFFTPYHIAVVGASTKNHWFFNMVGHAQRLGFAGRFHPINPGAGEVCGIPAVAAIADLPDDLIDFAAVIVRSSRVLSTIEELAGKGIRNVLLVSSGFSETGPEGKKLQEDLAAFCRDHDIMLMGPNCLGFMNVAGGTSVFAGGSVEGELVSGTIGIIGQSGAASEQMATKILRKGLGISTYVTTGNEAVMTAEDCLEYLIADGTTRVVAGFMEGFRDIPRLKRLALTAADRQIPIVLIKVGRSAKGVQAAASHTGALAGNERVMEAFLTQYGITRVDTIEELVETAGIFSRCPLPRGGRLAVCNLSGGLAGMYADLCQSLSIELPDFSPSTIAALREVLPEFAQPANPLDVTGSGFSSGMDRIVRIMLDDENTDIILTLSFPPAAESDTWALKLNESYMGVLRQARKPIVPVTFREVSDYARRYYREHELYYVEHVRDGLRAIAHLIRYERFLRARFPR